MKRFLLSVIAGALGSALLASGVARAQTKFHESNIKGVYVSTFTLNLNDPASKGLFVPTAGLSDAVHLIGTDVGKKGKCPGLVLPSGISASEIKTVAQGLLFGPGDVMAGVMQITYDGAGSLVGEADFNLFKDAAYSETKSLQTLNGVNSGFTSRICGGPNAATLDPMRCGPVCTASLGATAPFNCALGYPGSSGSNPNQGGGGYLTAADSTISTSTPATPNDVSSIDVLHFYISAFGLCGSAASFAQCCSDPDIDIVMHVPTVNSPGTGNVTQRFGVVGDPWASGAVNSVFSESAQ